MRLAKWDNLKFILMYTVVLGHFTNLLQTDSTLLSGMQVFVYMFHMPAFLFVSGLFSKKTVDERRYDKMFPYLVLYFFMVAFRFLVYSVAGGSVKSIRFFSEAGLPWFALVLFLFYIVTAQVSRLSHSYLLIVSIGMGMLAGYATNLGSFLSGMRFFTFYPFFLLGYCIPLDRLTQWTQKRWVKVSSAVFLLAVLAASYLYEPQLRRYMNFFKGKTTYAKVDMAVYGGICRGFYYLFVFALIIAVIAVVPSVRTCFTTWGQRTVQVFALHMPIIRVLMQNFHLEEHLAAWIPRYGCVVPVLALILTIVLSLRIWQPFFDWLMHGGRKKARVTA